MRDVWMVTETPFCDGVRMAGTRLVSVFESEWLAKRHMASVIAENPVTDWVDGKEVWVDCDVEKVVLQGVGV